MLQQLVWLIHMICAICIIILVLIQHGKGAEVGASMGGASQTIFGSQGSGSFLTKATTIFALIFAITSILLSFFINNLAKESKFSAGSKFITDLAAGSEPKSKIDDLTQQGSRSRSEIIDNKDDQKNSIVIDDFIPE